MLEVCKVDPSIVYNAIPDEIDDQNEDSVSRIKEEVEDEVRQPEGSCWNARHKLQVFALIVIVIVIVIVVVALVLARKRVD